jgi:hypothetical protein
VASPFGDVGAHSFELFNEVSVRVVCDGNRMSCIMDYLLCLGEL